MGYIRVNDAALSETAVSATTLPLFTNLRPLCRRCGGRRDIRVHGAHFHRLCPCGERWAEQTSETGRDAELED